MCVPALVQVYERLPSLEKRPNSHSQEEPDSIRAGSPAPQEDISPQPAHPPSVETGTHTDEAVVLPPVPGISEGGATGLEEKGILPEASGEDEATERTDGGWRVCTCDHPRHPGLGAAHYKWDGRGLHFAPGTVRESVAVEL